MNPIQFYVSVAVVPTVTIIIVLIGVVLNNHNMNARFTDINARFNDINARFNDINARFNDLRLECSARLEDLRDTLRAEMAKNQSELLSRIAELDNRLTRLEPTRR